MPEPKELQNFKKTIEQLTDIADQSVNHRNLAKELLQYLSLSPFGLNKYDLQLLLGDWQSIEDRNLDDLMLSNYHFSSLIKPLSPFISIELDIISFKSTAYSEWIKKCLLDDKLTTSMVKNTLIRFFLLKEDMEQERYTKPFQRFFVERHVYINLFKDYMSKEKAPMVLTGDSGCGKTALLIRAQTFVQEHYPDTITISHFVGASTDSFCWRKMIVRILEKIKTACGFTYNIPDDINYLRALFRKTIKDIPDNKTVMIIIDGLHLLEDKDNALDLIWLPEHFPPHVKLLLSTRQPQMETVLKNRHWHIITNSHPTLEEKVSMISMYIDHYKIAFPSKASKILNSILQTSNPGFLKGILEEVKEIPDESQFQTTLYHFAKAANIETLYQLKLQHKKDALGEMGSTVGTLYSLIACSKNGLSDSELRSLLSHHEKPLSKKIWNTILKHISTQLLKRSSLFSFSNNSLKQAVETHFLKSEAEYINCHRKLADYFSSIPTGKRKLDELPFHFSESMQWEKLHTFIADPDVVSHLWEIDQNQVMKLWDHIESHTAHQKLETYKEVIEHPLNHLSAAWNIEELLHNSGYTRKAIIIRESLTQHYSTSKNKKMYQLSLSRLGILYANELDYDKAMECYLKDESICREFNDDNGIQLSMLRQGIVYYHKGEHDKALELYRSQAEQCVKLGNDVDLSKSLNNQALIYEKKGKLDTALDMYTQAAAIGKSMSIYPSLFKYMRNLADVLISLEKTHDASSILDEVEHLILNTGYRSELGPTWNKKGDILASQGKYQEAIDMHKNREKLYKTLNDHLMVGSCIGKQASILRIQGDLQQALTLYNKQEQIFREHNYTHALPNCIGNQGNILNDMRHYSDALKKYHEEELLNRELGHTRNLVSSLIYQADIYCYQMHNPEEASRYLNNACDLLRTYPDEHLSNRANRTLDYIKRHYKI